MKNVKLVTLLSITVLVGCSSSDSELNSIQNPGVLEDTQQGQPDFGNATAGNNTLTLDNYAESLEQSLELLRGNYLTKAVAEIESTDFATSSSDWHTGYSTSQSCAAGGTAGVAVHFTQSNSPNFDATLNFLDCNLGDRLSIGVCIH